MCVKILPGFPSVCFSSLGNIWKHDLCRNVKLFSKEKNVYVQYYVQALRLNTNMYRL